MGPGLASQAATASTSEPRRGARRHWRKNLFGYVLVENVAYGATELEAMLPLEPLVVWTWRDGDHAVVAPEAGGPSFVARRVTPSSTEPVT